VSRATPPRHLADLSPAERDAWLVESGLPRMRGRQLAQHYFSHLSDDPAQMSDLPAGQRQDLVDRFLPRLATPVAHQSCDQGATVKTLFRLFDGARIETVVMAYPDRVTVCVSSQAGCAIGCPFCATGHLGLLRNLSAAEMVEQVRQAAALAQSGDLHPFYAEARSRDKRDGQTPNGSETEVLQTRSAADHADYAEAQSRGKRAGQPATGSETEVPQTQPRRLSNVVFLGMGEPLANYKALATALRAITAEPNAGFGISARKVTVSTCGLVNGIGRLAEEGLPVRLALSLHAPDDETRDRLVPINRRHPVRQVLAAAHDYFLATGRRVSIEYALIGGINDQQWRARLLAERISHYGTGWAHVNPIPLNPVAGSVWKASRPQDQTAFVQVLAGAGLAVTLRDTRGREIDGACGQLAAKEKEMV